MWAGFSSPDPCLVLPYRASHVLTGSASWWLGLPWSSWLLPSLMISFLLIPPVVLTFLSSHSRGRMSPFQARLHLSLLVNLHIAHLRPKSVWLQEWDSIMQNKTWLSKRCSWSTGSWMGYFSLKETMGVYLTHLIHIIIYKISWTFYLVAIRAIVNVTL